MSGEGQTPGEIPQSNALAEADPASLSELMSRDPESYNTQDRQAIIRALRADRARRSEAEAAAGASSPRKRTAKAETTQVPVSLKDLDL